MDREEEGIYFAPDGTGFITWSNLFVQIFDTFTWSIDDGHLSLSGNQKYILYHGKISVVSPSDIGEYRILVERVSSESLDDDEIDALVFPESFHMFTVRRLGFVCRNIWNIEFYSGLKGILKGNDHLTG